MFECRWESGSREGLTDVIVDPEWGAFGDNGCIDFIKTGEQPGFKQLQESVKNQLRSSLTYLFSIKLID